MTELNEPGIRFLERLLALSERSPDRTRPASAAPDYDALSKAAEIVRFQDQLVAAERSGAVALRYGRRERKHLIERVSVKDASILARHLGRKPSQVTAVETRQALEESIKDGAPWLVEILDEMEGRWSRGEVAYRLEPADVDSCKEFLTLLRAISRDEARGLDARSFALRATGDTKAFDRHSGRLLGVLGPRLGEASDAVWRRIGLERFAHPVHLRGPIVSEKDNGIAVDGRGRPFASIHPELIPSLRLLVTPQYVLSIENYASFNRHVREVDDGGLVVYTGGFASTGVIEVLAWILRSTDENIPLFHWGDIDPGGLRIFRCLEEVLPRPPRPHLMDRALAESHGKSAQPDASLASIAQSSSAIADLAAWLSRGRNIKHLEQEAISPVSPAANQ